jgi:hypothetical protein
MDCVIPAKAGIHLIIFILELKSGMCHLLLLQIVIALLGRTWSMRTKLDVKKGEPG